MDAANSFAFLLETGDVWQEPRLRVTASVDGVPHGLQTLVAAMVAVTEGSSPLLFNSIGPATILSRADRSRNSKQLFNSYTVGQGRRLFQIPPKAARMAAYAKWGMSLLERVGNMVLVIPPSSSISTWGPPRGETVSALGTHAFPQDVYSYRPKQKRGVRRIRL
jgi:hypothetical protein